MKFFQLTLLILFLIGCKPNSQPNSLHSPDLYQNLDFTISTISPKMVNDINSLSISFTVPLDPIQNFDQYIDVLNSAGKKVDGSWQLTADNKTLYFSAIKPGAEYKIELRAGLTSITNKIMDSPAIKVVTANNLSMAAKFINHGHLIPSNLHTGLPASAIGIKEVNVSFHRVRDAKVSEGLSTLTDNYQWNILSRLNDFSEHLYSGRFQTGAAKNSQKKFIIPVNKIKQLAKPGLYVAVMTPLGHYNKETYTYFTISDIGLHIRQYEDSMTIYTRSLQSGKALANVKLTIKNHDNKQVFTTKSDKHGIAKVSSLYSHQSYLLEAHIDQHLTIMRLNTPPLDTSNFDVSGEQFHALKLFLYGPRNLYRPGETVTINALLRDHDGNMIPKMPLDVKIVRPDDSLYDSFLWNSATMGYFQHSFSVDASEKTGRWRLEALLGNGDQFSYHFLIEDFLPERLKLEFTNQDKILQTTETSLLSKVKGSYLYGALADGNKITGSVESSINHHPIDQYKDYFFGIEGEQLAYDYTPDIKTRLNSQGENKLKFDIDYAEVKSPLTANISVSLFESGGRPVTRHYAQQIWPNKVIVGIKANFTGAAKTHNTANFELISIDTAGVLQKDSQYKITLTHQKREYFWYYDDYEGWQYNFNKEDNLALEQTMNAAEEGISTLKLPVTEGFYTLQIEDETHNSQSTLSFIVGESYYQDWQMAQQGLSPNTPDSIKLNLDKQAYNAGENIQLSFKAPSIGNALVLVESNGLLWQKDIAVNKAGSKADELKVNIPFNEKWDQHNTYISVIFFRAGNKANLITPKRSMGIIHLPRDSSSRKIDLSLNHKAKWQANSKTSIEISAIKEKNETIMVTLAGIDEGALSVNNYHAPDPLAFFFAKGRQATEALDKYGDIIELTDYQTAKLRYGAGENIQRGGKRAAADVNIVQLYQGPIKLDQNGKARLTFNVPSFNGSMRLIAHAFSQNRFAKTEKNVVVTAPVIAQLSLPRFLASGDSASLALDVTQLEQDQAEIMLEVSTLGAISSEPIKQSMTLAKGQKTIIYIPITAKNIEGKGEISVNITTTEGKSIDQKWSISVRPPYPALTQTKQTVIKAKQTQKIDLAQLPSWLPNTLQTKLTIAQGANLQLEKHLSFLKQYPYQCLEQTTSTAFPFLINKDSTMDVSASNKTKINQAIKRLMALQKSNGGFSLWDNYGDEEHWLTVYAVDFLTEAKARGFVIPNDVINKALDRLEEYITRQNAYYDERFSEKKGHYTASYKAYAVYVLAKENRLRLGNLRAVINRFSPAIKSPLPHVHFALAGHILGNNQIFIKQSEQAKTIKRDNGYLADFGSTIRDQATIINLLLKHKVLFEYATELSHLVSKEVHYKQWLSTQEHMAIALAAQQLQGHQNKTWQVTVKSEQSSHDLSGKGSKTFSHLPLSNTKSLSIKNLSDDSILVQSVQSGYSNNAPEPQSKGYTIKRVFLNKYGKELDPSNLTSGDSMLVHLKIKSSSYRPDTLIVDMLTAGWELENQNIATALPIDQIKVAGRSIADLVKNTLQNYQAFRDDRYISAVSIDKNETVNLFYLVRAVTPGKYTLPPTYVEDMFSPQFRAVGRVINNEINVHAR